MKKQQKDDVRQNNMQKNKKKALLVAKKMCLKNELKARQPTKQKILRSCLRVTSD
jgi:hypothetical protein